MKCSDSLSAFNANCTCSQTLRPCSRMLLLSVCLCNVPNSQLDPEWITDQLIKSGAKIKVKAGEQSHNKTRDYAGN